MNKIVFNEEERQEIYQAFVVKMKRLSYNTEFIGFELAQIAWALDHSKDCIDFEPKESDIA